MRETKSKRLVIVICATLVVLGTMLTVNPVKAHTYEPFLYVSPSYSNPVHPYFNNIESAVQYALIYAPPAPKKITVYPGTYPEQIVIPSSLSGVTIVARGKAILEGSQINATGFEIFGAHDVTIEGFIIQNYTFAGVYIHLGTAYANTIKDNTIRTNCGHGIAIVGSSSNSIKGNTIVNNRMHGIFIQNGFKNKIGPKNDILNNAWRGIELENAPKTIVKSNTVMYNLWDGLAADSGSSACSVKGNTFDNNGGSGIWAYSGLNSIENNEVNFNKLAGLVILDGSSNMVQSNQFNGNSYVGILVAPMMSFANFNAIINNTANNNGAGGIEVGGDSNKIEGNQANGNGYVGIVIAGGMAFPGMNKALYNVVLNNTANFNGGGGRGQGIIIVWADYTLVDLNQLNSNVQQGIYILNAMFNTVEHNQISSNGETGIFLEIAANNTIRWNQVHDNGGDGMLMWRFSSYNLIQYNGFNNNTGSGIAINNPVWALWEGSVHNNITGNLVQYNGYAGLWADSYADYTTIHSNEFRNNYLGIYVLSNHNNITHNFVFNNVPLDGISIVGGDYNWVEDNHVTSNGRHGIFVKSTGTGTLNAEFNTIKNNTVDYNNWNGIFILAADNTLVDANRVYSNVNHGIAVQTLMAYRPDYNKIINNYAWYNDNGYSTGNWYDIYWDYDLSDIGNTWRDSQLNFANSYGAPHIFPAESAYP